MSASAAIHDCFPVARQDAALLDAIRAKGLDTVVGAFAYVDGQDIDKPGLGHRRRTRLAIAATDGRNRELYLKRYDLEPLGRRIGRVVTCGFRSPAEVEHDNILLARQAGIATMESIAHGQERRLLTVGRSYIIVTAVPGDALSRCCKDFLARHAQDDAPMRLAVKLADMAGRMHKAGLVHRDFYTTHIFLDDRGDDYDLYLIDLARMFRPRWRKFRWRVKDLAQLKFSMPKAWVNEHWETFLTEYFGKIQVECGWGKRYRHAIDRKAAWMLRRHERMAARLEAAR